MDVSVLIVCWNSASCIGQCLASLDSARHQSTVEIILVDNGSRDATASIVRSKFPHVTLVEAGANLGFAGATNLASRRANGRYLFLLNPDAEVEPQALDTLVSFMDSHPEAGAASPKLLNQDGTPALFAIREFPSLSNVMVRQFGLRKLLPRNRYFGKETLTARDRDSVSHVPCVSGAALILRRSLFKHLGGLNEELPMYFEDMDLCARIGRRQLIYHVPAAQVVHIGGKSADGASARSLLLAMENGEAPWMYLRRYRGPLHARGFTIVTFASNLLRLAALSSFLPVAFLFWPVRASWIRTRIKRSLALLGWCVNSRKSFYARIGKFFDLAKRAEFETAA